MRSATEITLEIDSSPANVRAGYQEDGPVSAPPAAPRMLIRRFHAGYFRIGMSLGGQVLLWKTVAGAGGRGGHETPVLVLWCVAFLVILVLSLVYLLRCLLDFRMVEYEFLHHVGVNYLFAPSISWLLLLQSAPFLAPLAPPYKILWSLFAIPVLLLDVKIYGQWFTKGRRFLFCVANPTSQLSVIGNLVGAQAAGRMGWKESGMCLFSLGMVHYLVLFVTLYQRSSGADRLPSMLRPVFFLYIAAPSVASLAWESITGAFDAASKMLFFLSLFLFTALVQVFKFSSMKRFNIAWWAFSFPLSALALASIEYHHQVRALPAKILMFLLLGLSVFVIVSLVAATLLNSDMLLRDDDPLLNGGVEPHRRDT
ncbi:S-type anion channel SLAH1-like [Momordica charantia]|uniref:S-type anion channel SLAH1-like n=1 Tax=Momordica charantia TaxID=3673 RepID=A0A6J1C7M1_MOMCH|nr:S-type anion channel SLAH1-like [Momordica charantia]